MKTSIVIAGFALAALIAGCCCGCNSCASGDDEMIVATETVEGEIIACPSCKTQIDVAKCKAQKAACAKDCTKDCSKNKACPKTGDAKPCTKTDAGKVCPTTGEAKPCPAPAK